MSELVDIRLVTSAEDSMRNYHQETKRKRPKRGKRNANRIAKT